MFSPFKWLISFDYRGVAIAGTSLYVMLNLELCIDYEIFYPNFF